MLVNGVVMKNITCRTCKFRHPLELTCVQAKALVKPKKPEAEKLSLEDRIEALELEVARLKENL